MFSFARPGGLRVPGFVLFTGGLCFLCFVPFGQAQEVDAAQRMTDLARQIAGEDAGDGGAVPGVAVAPVENTLLGGTPKSRRAFGGDGPADAGGEEQEAVVSKWGGSGVLATLSALGVVIGLVFLVRWLVAKASGTPIATSSSAVEVLSRSSVAPRNHVLLLRVGPRVLVVGESSGGLRTLSEVTDENEVASLLQAVESARPQSIAGGFGSLLGRFNKQYDADTLDGQGATPIDKFAEGLDTSEAPMDRARDSLASLSARLKMRSGRGDAS